MTDTLIDRSRSCLLVVDMQERLAPDIAEGEAAVRNAGILLQAARRLGVPVLVSEQYPHGLGRTLPALRSLAPDDAVVEKLHFSCAAEPALRARIDGLGRPQIVVCGMETHVCVLQSALGLKQAGYSVFVVADAVGSRTPASRAAGLERMRAAGIAVVTTEMAIFEWLHRAGSDEFREVRQLIR